MEVESTIRPAKDRIAGFEGREGHRTPFASVVGKVIRLQSLRSLSNFQAFVLRLSATGGSVQILETTAYTFVLDVNSDLRNTFAGAETMLRAAGSRKEQ